MVPTEANASRKMNGYELCQLACSYHTFIKKYIFSW